MKQILTSGMVLTRTDYGEADRIITVLTPDQGKLRLIAKGVRKAASKLAGGIELFSISQLSYIPGKGEIGTLTSTRLKTNFGSIVKDLNRTMLGYELLKRLNRATEDATGDEYYELLAETLAALDNREVSSELIESWFNARLLNLAGHQPNLKTDSTSQKLDVIKKYNCDPEVMIFVEHVQGRYGASHIKLLRLLFGLESPTPLVQIKDIEKVLPDCSQLVKTMLTTHIRT